MKAKGYQPFRSFFRNIALKQYLSGLGKHQLSTVIHKQVVCVLGIFPEGSHVHVPAACNKTNQMSPTAQFVQSFFRVFAQMPGCIAGRAVHIQCK